MAHQQPRLGGCANFAVWLAITLISFVFFPLGLAIWGILALVLGELTIVWNRKVFGNQARILGVLLLISAMPRLGLIGLTVTTVIGLILLFSTKPSETTEATLKAKSQPSHPQAWLAIRQFGNPEWRFPLDGRTHIYLGRGASDHVKLTHDLAADERHAVIYLEGGHFYINNLSPKGTWVNGIPIAKQILINNSTIQAGNTIFTFQERL